MLFLTLFSVNIFSGVKLYQIKIKSFVNRKSTSRAHLILRVNQAMGFTDKMGNHIEVTVSQKDDEAPIILRFEVSRDLEDGTAEVVTSPEISATENEPSKFTFENINGEEVSVVTEVKRI